MHLGQHRPPDLDVPAQMLLESNLKHTRVLSWSRNAALRLSEFHRTAAQAGRHQTKAPAKGTNAHTIENAESDGTKQVQTLKLIILDHVI
ncbi:hypothetical protein VC83_02630 [Pseudogymnoascus destructans]|uniref:Uncharacterized protein n=1 Tax=Pseudogymnoascus destructans TaxID=655981 RepID=A0A177AFY3_9PEZI|nr:uncharacterized protein VC83_02630 [Pseudogymnoascus destructans]OAF61026.1 hypothetical protein VC83_02630 [Pseudogymnoascus destructans]